MKQRLQFLRSQGSKIAAAIALAAVHGMTFASSTGGLAAATSTANDIKNAFYLFVGVCASIYLLFIGVLAFTEKKSWSDFGWAVLHVALVGGSAALAGWAWTLFA